MPVLYLTEQGATLRKDGGTFLITKEDRVLEKVPAAKVEQVVIFGNVNITTPVIHFLLSEGIDCVFCSSTGRYHGRLISTESKFGLLRQSQFQAVSNTETKVNIARQMVKGKLLNLRTILMRYLREEANTQLAGAVDSLRQAVLRLGAANDIGIIQGIRRPPRDPVNSLLSFGYTLLVYDIQAAIRTVGLDPFLGFLHTNCKPGN